MKSSLYLLLGSNLNNRMAMLEAARGLLEKKLGKVVAASSYYATAPWGNTEQPEFLNQVLAFATDWSPEDLLNLIHETEWALGRKRMEKWGPRTIDVDILSYGSILVNNEGLNIPHTELPNRRFALEPLCEIAASEIHPVLMLTYAQLLIDCKDPLPVRKIDIIEPAV